MCTSFWGVFLQCLRTLGEGCLDSVAPFTLVSFTLSGLSSILGQPPALLCRHEAMSWNGSTFHYAIFFSSETTLKQTPSQDRQVAIRCQALYPQAHQQTHRTIGVKSYQLPTRMCPLRSVPVPAYRHTHLSFTVPSPSSILHPLEFFLEPSLLCAPLSVSVQFASLPSLWLHSCRAGLSEDPTLFSAPINSPQKMFVSDKCIKEEMSDGLKIHNFGKY